MLMLMSSGLLCCQVNVCFTWLKGGVPPRTGIKKSITLLFIPSRRFISTAVLFNSQSVMQLDSQLDKLESAKEGGIRRMKKAVFQELRNYKINLEDKNRMKILTELYGEQQITDDQILRGLNQKELAQAVIDGRAVLYYIFALFYISGYFDFLEEEKAEYKKLKESKK